MKNLDWTQQDLEGFKKLMELWRRSLNKGKWLLWFSRICLAVGVVLFVGVVVVLLWRGELTVEMWLAVSGILLAVAGIALSSLSHSYALLGVKMSMGFTKYANVIARFVRMNHEKQKGQSP